MKPKVINTLKLAACNLLLLIFLCCSSVPVQALPMESEQQKVEIQYQDPQKFETPSVFWMILQMLLALAVILALAWGLIRIWGGKLRGRLQGKWIRVLDEVTLGPNRGIAIVEIGGNAFIVGVTDHQISLLAEVNDTQLIQEMVAAALDDSGRTPVMAGMVWNNIKDQVLSGLNKKATDRSFEGMVDQRMQKLERMSDRMRKLNNGDLEDDRWKQ